MFCQHRLNRCSNWPAFIASWVEVSRSVLQRRWPTSCSICSVLQLESSSTLASATERCFTSGEASFTDWMLTTGFGSESVCSSVCKTRCLSLYQPMSSISVCSHLCLADHGKLYYSHIILATCRDWHLPTLLQRHGTQSVMIWKKTINLSLSTFKYHLMTFFSSH